MNEMKHTPGPWRFEDGVVDQAEGGVEICTIRSSDDFPCITETEDKTEAEARAEVDAECEANGRLIAAAPDLFAELEVREGDLVFLRKAIEAGDPKAELLFRIDDMLRETRAALSRATAS